LRRHCSLWPPPPPPHPGPTMPATLPTTWTRRPKQGWWAASDHHGVVMGRSMRYANAVDCLACWSTSYCERPGPPCFRRSSCHIFCCYRPWFKSPPAPAAAVIMMIALPAGGFEAEQSLTCRASSVASLWSLPISRRHNQMRVWINSLNTGILGHPWIP